MEVNQPILLLESSTVVKVLVEQAESSQSANFRSALVLSKYEILQSVEDKQ